MAITVIELSCDELIRRRDEILSDLRMSEDELRDRALRETATTEERSMLARLDEISFLLGEDDG